MPNHVYRVIEVVGSSPDGVDAAIRNAVARAARTTRNLDWFETGVAYDLRGDLHRAGIVAGDRYAQLFTGSMCFAREPARAG